MNTLFARTVLLSVVMLLAVHAGYRLLLLSGTPWLDGEAGTSADASLQDVPELAAIETAGIRPVLAARPRFVDLAAPVVPRLPSVLWPVASGSDAGGVATLGDDAPEVNMLDPSVALTLLALPAALIALCIPWFHRARHALQAVARMAREADACAAPGSSLRAAGGDVRRLAGMFSELKCRQSRALDDQSAALEAFSRHLDTLVARLRARAMQISHWHKRVAFVEDIDLFSRVARQFVDVAAPRSAATRSNNVAQAAHVGVDAYLRDRFFYGSTTDDARIALTLTAGPDFALPRAALERLIGNLVGNALAHGSPPIDIATARGPRAWTLSVRDHGAGIGERDLAAVLQPFVRLPSASEGRHAAADREDHWGLGLSIVSRLAHECGAKLKLGNHPGGGLWVRVIVPVA